MGHPVGSNLTLLFYLVYFFLTSFNKVPFSYISDKKLVSIRIKAMDYFLKSSGVFKLRELVNLSQSPFSRYRWKIFIDSMMIYCFVLFCCFFWGGGGGVPVYSGVSWGCSGSVPGLFRLLQTPHVSRYHELNLSCLEQLVVFGLSTMNSNRTNHKLRKKLANQKCQHVSLRFSGIRTRYWHKFADALHRRFRASATSTKQHVTPWSWAQFFPVKPWRGLFPSTGS